MNIKRIFESKGIWQPAIIIALIAVIVSIIGILVAQEANRYSEEANGYSKEANKIAKESYTISNEIFKTKAIPRLIVFPMEAKFYTPENPEAPGQVKINLSAMIENLSETNAMQVAINFETKDWYEHKTNLFNIYKEAHGPTPHILSLPKNSRLFYPSYAPDAPASGESGFLNQNKPFKVKITLYWKDINDNEYVYVGFYDLKSAPLPNNENRLYFQPVSTYDSVNDGDLAWEYAKKSL